MTNINPKTTEELLEARLIEEAIIHINKDNISQIWFTFDLYNRCIDLLIEKFEKADLINRDTVFIGVERGGIFPKDRLSRKYSENKTNYATMKTRAYHSDNNSLKDGKVYIDPNIIGKESVLKAKNIVILDDLIDTGITFIELKKYLTILNPNAKIITAAVLEKPQLKLKSRLKPDIYGVKLQENWWIVLPQEQAEEQYINDRPKEF